MKKLGLPMQQCYKDTDRDVVRCRRSGRVADNLTKANPTDLFKYLRDSMNGYAAAMLNDPDREMPVECITMSELSSMLKSLAEQDAMKAAKKAEQAAKKRKK